MKRRVKILGAVLGAGLFGSLALGTTLALYQSNKTVNNHLKSGGMDAEFYLLELKNDRLNNDGTITKDVAADLSGYDGWDSESIGYVDHDTHAQSSHVGSVDLAVYSGEVFAVENIVPTMQGSAKFLVKNGAATDANDSVAFGFDIALLNKQGGEELISQVDITLGGATWDNNPVLSGEGKVFTVNWEFKDKTDNNDAMNQQLTFDISITCTQIQRA